MSELSVSPVESSESYQLAWDSLVGRSISTWNKLGEHIDKPQKNRAACCLQSFESLDEFLDNHSVGPFFWFFQRRDSFMIQRQMSKWSRNTLDDYVLLPAEPGFVLRRDCFFVSHFWESSNHPDPEGKYLRLHQNELRSQPWSYIWVDWSCMPQAPRSNKELKYFNRSLQTMSGIIRNSAFIQFYPPFKPRLWILYEVTEFTLTCHGKIEPTPDIAPFLRHVSEMISTSVQATLEKYNYECSSLDDRAILTSWLELLVLLHQQRIDIIDLRRIMDHLTWQSSCEVYHMIGSLKIAKFDGILTVNGSEYRFSPFPRLVSVSIYAANKKEIADISC
jgi:hypothetical protein